MPRQLPHEFHALLHRQNGVFSRSQAQRCGVSADRIGWNVRAERWRRVYGSVYAAFTGPLHERHRWWAAVLAAGTDACLSHVTAAYIHRLVPVDGDSVHVMVPARRRVVAPEGVVVHRSRAAFRAGGSPPATCVEDTLCDLASAGWSADRLAAVVSKAAQRGVVDARSFAGALERRGTFRGAELLRGLVADSLGGAHSALEHRYLRDVERAHRLPRGARQVRRRRAGALTVADVTYSKFGVLVELDGRAFHDTFDQRIRDARRDRLAVLSGETTLRYTWEEVAATPCVVAVEVAAVLAARGWRGAHRRCRRCGGSAVR